MLPPSVPSPAACRTQLSSAPETAVRPTSGPWSCRSRRRDRALLALMSGHQNGVDRNKPSRHQRRTRPAPPACTCTTLSSPVLLSRQFHPRRRSTPWYEGRCTAIRSVTHILRKSDFFEVTPYRLRSQFHSYFAITKGAWCRRGSDHKG